MDIIEVKDLCFAYGEGRNVIDGLSLSIEKGSFTAIVGRNGSGKSTLARCFNAINLPAKGKVISCGFDTADTEHIYDIRSRVGMVFQNPDDQTVAALVEDEVAFGPENLGIEPSEIRKRVDEALDTVGMSKYALSSAASLSGGQKQRVAIAGVLAMRPEVMILDEATAMLDPKGRDDVMRAAIRANAEAGTTVIHITHFMEEAVCADRVIVLDGGKIAADGTPREVFAQTELIRAAGLEPPPAARLAAALREAGVPVGSDALTMDELYRELIRLKHDKI